MVSWPDLRCPSAMEVMYTRPETAKASLIFFALASVFALSSFRFAWAEAIASLPVIFPVRNSVSRASRWIRVSIRSLASPGAIPPSLKISFASSLTPGSSPVSRAGMVWYWAWPTMLDWPARINTWSGFGESFARRPGTQIARRMIAKRVPGLMILLLLKGRSWNKSLVFKSF